MSTNDGGPIQPAEVLLSPDESIVFCEDYVVPCVDYLAGEGFVDHALPGSSFEITRKAPTIDGALRIGCSVEIWMRYSDDDSEPLRTYTIKVLEEKQHLERSQEILDLALTSGADCLDGDEDAYDPEDPDEDQLQAWFVQEYVFSNSPVDPAELHKYWELQDGCGNSHWDELDVGESFRSDEDTKPLSPGEAAILRTIEDGILSGLSRDELLGAISIFLSLGVPEDFAQVPDDTVEN